MWIKVNKLPFWSYGYCRYNIYTNVDICNHCDLSEVLTKLMGNAWSDADARQLGDKGAKFFYTFKSAVDISEKELEQRFAKTFCQEGESKSKMAWKFGEEYGEGLRNGLDLEIESLGSISEPTFDYKEDNNMSKVKLMKYGSFGIFNGVDLTITDIKFNKDTTIVFWSDDTKTVVTRKMDDNADPEAAVAQAICKKLYGSTSAFHRMVQKCTSANAKNVRHNIDKIEKKIKALKEDDGNYFKKNEKEERKLIKKLNDLYETLRTMGERYYE